MSTTVFSSLVVQNRNIAENSFLEAERAKIVSRDHFDSNPGLLGES
jgi:hypothetical protein